MGVLRLVTLGLIVLKVKKKSKVNFLFESELKPNRYIIDDNGCVFNKRPVVLLDSGCSTIVVKDSRVPSNYKCGRLVRVYNYLGIPNYFPQIKCFIKSMFLIAGLMP